MKKTPKSRERYKTEEAWQNAQESKRRYCRRYRREHKDELLRKVRVKRAKVAKVRERRRARFAAVEEEFGAIVIKLNFELGMSTENIYELFGGLISSDDVRTICRQETEKRRKLSASMSKQNDQPR